jgi:hypothetical protein
MESVFIVSGWTGEYAEMKEWSVRAFGSREEANGLVGRLTEWCDARGLGSDCEEVDRAGKRGRWCDRSEAFGSPPEDPGFRVDANGTQYLVKEVPFGPVNPAGGAR